MFVADVLGINADDKYIDEKGAFDISKCNLIAYANGGYYALGDKKGKFGFSVQKQKKYKKNDPYLIIPNTNKSNNLLEIFNDNEYYKNSKKVYNKNEDSKKKKQNPSKKKNSKKGSKNELSNINLKNIDLISNEIKKSKQKLNQNKKSQKMNLKRNIVRRKNVNTIANIKSFTEKINDCCNKEFIFHKISNLISKNNSKRKKKKSQQSSNNFNFYVINKLVML